MLHLSICPSSLDHQEFQGLLSIHSVLCCHFPFFFIFIFSSWWVQGLQDEIKLVPLILQNRPAWYSEKVYPPNKVNTSFLYASLMLPFTVIRHSYPIFQEMIHYSLIFLSIFVDNIAGGHQRKKKKNPAMHQSNKFPVKNPQSRVYSWGSMSCNSIVFEALSILLCSRMALVKLFMMALVK